MDTQNASRESDSSGTLDDTETCAFYALLYHGFPLELSTTDSIFDLDFSFSLSPRFCSILVISPRNYHSTAILYMNMLQCHQLHTQN